jgi:pimeloyl-ACP methyl ester carboxylesterase
MTSSLQERAPAESTALARLTLEELAGATGGIGQVHRAVAGRVFRQVGPSARVVETVHDAIVGGVYAGLRGGARALGAVAERTVPPRTLSTTPPGRRVLAILNGLIGDTLEREGSPLQEPMAVRVAGGEVVPPRPEALARAFTQAAPRLVVFLHGLMETEFSWSYGEAEPYGERLARDLGCTPLYVRYNTGRRISENGSSLAEMLEEVARHWPVAVEGIALVGHSMGGLIARSACHQATAAQMDWVRQVRHVVSLGSPHMGAPLEQAVHYASAALTALPETAPLGRFLRRRSGGIRDLRRGSLVDADWREREPDALRAEACEEVPLLEGATHCFVAATVTRSARHPVGRLIGDVLVLQPSASGRSRSRRIGFRDEDGLHVGGAHHLALLNHPAVYERLVAWLSA